MLSIIFSTSISDKLGFKREGTLKKHVMIDGKFYDSILHLKFINT